MFYFYIITFIPFKYLFSALHFKNLMITTLSFGILNDLDY